MSKKFGAQVNNKFVACGRASDAGTCAAGCIHWSNWNAGTARMISWWTGAIVHGTIHVGGHPTTTAAAQSPEKCCEKHFCKIYHQPPINQKSETDSKDCWPSRHKAKGLISQSPKVQLILCHPEKSRASRLHPARRLWRTSQSARKNSRQNSRRRFGTNHRSCSPAARQASP